MHPLNVLVILCLLNKMVHSYRPMFSRIRGLHQRSTSAALRRLLPNPLRATHSMPDFSKEAAEKHFEFERLEKSIYGWWESEGMFKPDSKQSPGKTSKKAPFVVPMPPPNVTGYLHMGHAIFVALQDIMARFQRMRGRPTLWLPGTDHAGIATQLLVERQLNKEGVTRQDLGREAFLQRAWAWKEEKGGYISAQMRRLGASADWSREKFTLQPDMSEAVTEAFIRLHEKGLIYRGSYMVNWSPHLQTAVSDLEVEHSEEQGTLYYFKYTLSESDSSSEPQGGKREAEFIPVATTRPETILGDAAVCVHPEDERYARFIGRTVKVPFCDRTIPVIADTYVDPAFGTGALKITPAHDPNDYALARRHALPLISVMNRDASINHLGGARYAGLSREDCRARLWKDLVEAGLVLNEHTSARGGPGTKDHTQRVPRSQRGGEIIEPMVSPQWFVRTEGMAARAVQAVRGGDVAIVPERFEKVWYNWLENIHDWCISRQLWWGHRIPVYYVTPPAGSPAGESGPPYIVARTPQEAQARAVALYGAGAVVAQDEDVLDTWFSSGLWPFATVGWPQQEGLTDSDLQRFYPASVLETGYDILFFWVARMVMLGLELTDKAPFHTIYLHGLVRDAEGQKMSKTKGNVLDPLDVIALHGADALRYSLVTGSAPGNDVPLAMEKIESNRNFANKLWNAGKYVQICLSGARDDAALLDALTVRGPMSAAELASLPVPERYIVSRCHVVVQEVTRALEALSFGDAGRVVHDFLWDELADWYIEASKVRMRAAEGGAESVADAADRQQRTRRVLVYVWETCMRLLHPFMPYLTETLWQQLPHSERSVMLADWPQLQDDAGSESALPTDAAAVQQFGSLQATVRSIRNARAEYGVDPGRKIPCVLVVADAALRAVLQQERSVFALLGRVQDAQLLILAPEEAAQALASAGACVHLIVEEEVEAYLPQSGLLDPQKERARLSRQAEKLGKDIQVLSGRLSSAGFVDRAPPHLVAEARTKLAELQDQLNTVNASMDALL